MEGSPVDAGRSWRLRSNSRTTMPTSPMNRRNVAGILHNAPGISERRGVGGLSDRSDTARAGRGLSDRPGGCDVGGSAARFVQAEDELPATGTPGAMELRLVAVAAGGVPHPPAPTGPA